MLSPSDWTTLEKSIAKTIRQWKREGTTGASFACLKQCVPTTGLTCTPYAFHSTFNQIAAEVAKRLRFSVYEHGQVTSSKTFA